MVKSSQPEHGLHGRSRRVFDARMVRIAAFVLTVMTGFWVTPEVGAAERIIKKDGSALTGEVVGFQNGNYTVRVGNTIVEVPATDVRTILEGAGEKKALQEDDEHLTLERLLEYLSLRRKPPEGTDHRRMFEDAIAAVLRSDWDFALKGLEHLRSREPRWADPQMLAGMVRASRGETEQALVMGKRLEQNFDGDDLAQEVAAEIYRRAGFGHGYATVMERVLTARIEGLRLPYELTRLWWSVDEDKGRNFWKQYLANDPELAQRWCREGDSLRQIRMALGAEDWQGAQAVLADCQRRYPWMGMALKTLRGEVLEARLRSAESNSRLEEALIAGDALQDLVPERAEEWRGRVEGLRSFVVTRGMELTQFEEFYQWSVDNGHLLTGSERRSEVAQHFHDLGLEALGTGYLERGRLALQAATDWDESARPDDLMERLRTCCRRVQDDVRIGRWERARGIITVLRDAFPEERAALVDELSSAYRRGLRHSHTKTELSRALADLQSLFEAPKTPVTPPPVERGGGFTSGVEGEVMANASALTRSSVDPVESYAAFSTYFPHTPGTVWIYRRGDGKREERRVVSLTPRSPEGWRIGIEVKVEGEAAPFVMHCYLTNGDLIMNYPTVPPGECELAFLY